MALIELIDFNKYGTFRKRIVYSPTTQFTINPKEFGKFVSVRVFKYEHIHIYPPHIFEKENKKYILPTWQEIHPETTINDIEWIKEEVEKPKEQTSWKFKSNSSDAIYTVHKIGDKLTCSCPGITRSKTKSCKHTEEVKNILQ